MLSIFDLATLLLTLSAAFGYLNLRWLKLPHTIGMLVMGLGASVILLVAHEIIPGLGITEALQGAIGQIDFYSTIMNGLLAFLLFAGALHVDFAKLRDQAGPIAFLASAGVVISTVVIGFGLWWASAFVGLPVPLAWCMVFGALISPTDPVAVLSLLKTVQVPESLKVRIAGESLFNDGVAVVMYSLLVAVALAAEAHEATELTAWRVGELFLVEGGGGALFGLVMGIAAVRAMRRIDEHVVEILISLATCALTYAVSLRLHISGPIAVVVAALFIGNRGAQVAMTARTRDYLFAFWEVIDEVLNSVLFLLIGLEVLVLSFDLSHGWLALAAIPLVLAGRLVSVASPLIFKRVRASLAPGAIPVMTWGGLRGGVSVALALSVPAGEYKDELLAATYAVVIFSIVVQGLTVRRVIDRTMAPQLL